MCLSWQKMCFVTTNTCFVATSIHTKCLSWQKWCLWQLPSMIDVLTGWSACVTGSLKPSIKLNSKLTSIFGKKTCLCTAHNTTHTTPIKYTCSTHYMHTVCTCPAHIKYTPSTYSHIAHITYTHNTHLIHIQEILYAHTAHILYTHSTYDMHTEHVLHTHTHSTHYVHTKHICYILSFKQYKLCPHNTYII